MSQGLPEVDVQWRLVTPSRAGAIAIIELLGLSGDAINDALERIGVGRLETGDVELRTIASVDRGLVARWSDELVHMMPHGGAAVVRAIADELDGLGIKRGDAGSPNRDGDEGSACSYPEGTDEIECHMLAALSRAQSPLAVDLLLAQPERWRTHDGNRFAPTELDRLIDPPLVIVRGRANVGKSTLVNAMAGRAVSVVADEPGTTRDHVGVSVNMAGLVVRLLDLPGEREGAPEAEREAMKLASNLAESADLILWCGDQNERPREAEDPSSAGETSQNEHQHLTVSLKSDLGVSSWRPNHTVSAHSGDGMAELVRGVRDALISPHSLTDPRPWRFWRVD